MSWETFDEHLSLDTLKEKYRKIVSSPRINPLFVLILVGFANASFCKLFGGDWCSVGIVFSSTIAGLFLRQQMAGKGINHFVIFIASAFVASMCASTSVIFDTTSEIALATSVLYLVPGGSAYQWCDRYCRRACAYRFARLTQAALLIVCIAIGTFLYIITG